MVAPSSDVGDEDIEMPSYHIRHSIATKVAAKKTAKGYTLSDESCSVCEMPLMTLNGSKAECKVCPAIKKWVQRKNEADGYDKIEDKRDDACAASRDGTAMRDCSLPDCVKSVDADDALSDEKAIGLGTTESKESESNTEYLMNKEMEGEQAQKNDESDDDDDEEDRSELTKTDSDESEDTDAIRARARQIILEARGRGEWGTGHSEDEGDDEDDNAITSPHLSWDDENLAYSQESIDESSCIQGRAVDIINQARKNLQAGYDLDGDLPEEIISPPIDIDAEMHISASLEEVLSPGVGSWEATIVIQSAARRYLAKQYTMGKKLAESKAYNQDDSVRRNESCPGHDKGSKEVDVKSERSNTLTDDKEDEWEAATVENPCGIQATRETVTLNDVRQYTAKQKNPALHHSQDNAQCDKQDDLNDVQQHMAEQKNPALHHSQGNAQCDEQDDAECDDAQDEAQKNIQDDTQAQYLAQDGGHENPQGQDEEDQTRMNDNEHYNTNVGQPEKDTSFSVDKKSEFVAEESSQPGLLTDETQVGPQANPQIVQDIVPQCEPQVENVAARQYGEKPLSDYPMIPQMQPEPTRAVAPQRGLFAQLACKFDDAVTEAMGRVHSIVTCSMSDTERHGEGLGVGNFGDNFDAEQCQFKTGVASSFSSQAKYEEQTTMLTTRRWGELERAANSYSDALPLCPEPQGTPMQEHEAVKHATTCTGLIPQRPHEMKSRQQVMPSFHASALLDVTTTQNGTASGASKTEFQHPVPKSMNQSRPIVQALENTPLLLPTKKYDPPNVCVPSKNNEPMGQDGQFYNQIQMMTIPPRNEWVQDDTKENAYIEANVNQQLQDARLRIEDAKKFIMSRSTRMTTTPLSGLPLGNGVRKETTSGQTMNNVDNLSQQAGAFKQTQSMMTPTAAQLEAGVNSMSNTTPGAGPQPNWHLPTSMHPGMLRQTMLLPPGVMNHFPVRNQVPGMHAGMPMLHVTNITATPGANLHAPTPEMRAMGSLMSPGTETNANIAQKEAGQRGTEIHMHEVNLAADHEIKLDDPPAPENDGYNTPQMPGRYFFASSP